MSRAEDGFTLVELLAAVAVVGIIGYGVSVAVVLALRTTDLTADRVAGSADRQLVSSFFVTDVQSADDVSLTDSFCGGVAPLIRFRWADAMTGAVNYASYAVEGSGAERRLVRRHCVTTGIPVDRQELATRLAASPAPTVPPCSPDPCKPATVTVALRDADGSTYTVSAQRRTA